MPAKSEAIIFAAGKGTRMQSYEANLPKPLVPVAGKALIDYAFDLLKANGINQTIVNSHHKAEMLRQHLTTAPLNCVESFEPELLETGGGINHAKSLLTECFFTLNSDVICIESANQRVLHQLKSQFDASHMDGLLLLCPLDKAIGYDGDGDFSLSDSGQLQLKQKGKPAYVYMGVQYMHGRFMDGSPEGAFSLSQLFRAAIAKGDACPLYGMVHSGAWLHVGNADGVKKAEAFLAQSLIKTA